MDSPLGEPDVFHEPRSIHRLGRSEKSFHGQNVPKGLMDWFLFILAESNSHDFETPVLQVTKHKVWEKSPAFLNTTKLQTSRFGHSGLCCTLTTVLTPESFLVTNAMTSEEKEPNRTERCWTNDDIMITSVSCVTYESCQQSINEFQIYNKIYSKPNIQILSNPSLSRFECSWNCFLSTCLSSLPFSSNQAASQNGAWRGQLFLTTHVEPKWSEDLKLT